MATDRQKELLSKEDWRFHAIGPVGTGLGMLATTERLDKKIYNLGLPSAPALFLNLAREAHVRRSAINLNQMFSNHEQGRWPENHGPLFDFIESFASEVICSFTALEAFANEIIPKDFKYAFTRKKGEPAEVLIQYEIERVVPLDEKLSSVLPKAHKIATPKGLKPWQDYKTLKHFRNRLIHLKSLDRNPSGPEDQTLWGAMLKNRNVVFPDIAHRMIGHFAGLANGRRWFELYKSPTE